MEHCFMIVEPICTSGSLKRWRMTSQTSHHDHVEKLAHHAFAGELWDKAVELSERRR